MGRIEEYNQALQKIDPYLYVDWSRKEAGQLSVFRCPPNWRWPIEVVDIPTLISKYELCLYLRSVNDVDYDMSQIDRMEAEQKANRLSPELLEEMKGDMRERLEWMAESIN